jgi:hypothetical protein
MSLVQTKLSVGFICHLWVNPATQPSRDPDPTQQGSQRGSNLAHGWPCRGVCILSCPLQNPMPPVSFELLPHAAMAAGP